MNPIVVIMFVKENSEIFRGTTYFRFVYFYHGIKYISYVIQAAALCREKADGP